MRLLLDTHTLIWFLAGNQRMPVEIRRAIESRENVKYLSIASAWEMAIKVARNKLTLPIPFEALFHRRLEILNVLILPVESHHLHRLCALPHHHGDPFDRMLIAQALSEDFTIVGCDAAFDAYGVKRAW